MSRHARAPVLATVAAGLLWGSSFAVIKIGLRSIDPYWFAFLRFAVASAIALVYVAVAGKGREVAALLRRPVVIWLGIANAVGFVLQFKGQTLTTAANAALLINSCAIYVAIASRFVFRERFGLPKIVAVALGIAGVVLVTTNGRLEVVAGPGLVGDLIIVGASLSWTVFILLDKHIVGGHEVDVRSLTAAMVVVTALAALPAALLFAPRSFPAASPELWAIPYTAVFCTILPFFLWTWGLRHITATVSSVIMLTEVVFALILSYFILGERLSAGSFAGSVLILVAVALASREPHEEAAAGPDVVHE